MVITKCFDKWFESVQSNSKKAGKIIDSTLTNSAHRNSVSIVDLNI